jgi:3-oxoacyl-[acyl-carrier protein] reductase
VGLIAPLSLIDGLAWDFSQWSPYDQAAVGITNQRVGASNSRGREVQVLLEGKNAVVYGAGGSVGSAVARAFAREGAAVFLAGRSRPRLETAAEAIARAGGTARVAEVDALDEAAILQHADRIAQGAGSLDVSFNAISVDHIQGVALADMSLEQIVEPVADRVATHLLTARAAAHHMAAQGHGVILTFSADAARIPYPEIGSFGIACAAIEGLTRSLAAELGPRGIRVICLRSMGSPDAPNVEGVWEQHFGTATSSRDEVFAHRAAGTLLGRLPVLDEVGNVAALMASDHASPLTATVVNVACGEIAD